MQTFTFRKNYLPALLLLCSLYTGSSFANTKNTIDNQDPILTFSEHGSSDVGERVTSTISAYDPDKDRVTLTLDRIEAWGNNTPPSLSDVTFSTKLPTTASGTATTTLSWVPKREQLGFISFHFSAVDQHGNLTTDELIFFVDIPLQVEPMPAVQLAANEAFELIIPVEDADWHELNEPVVHTSLPGWLKIETVPLNGTGGANSIRISGKPRMRDAGKEYKFTIFLSALFGKEAKLESHLIIVKGKNQNWYRDRDGDGYGAANSGGRLTASTSPQGYAGNARDCNDGDAAIHPGATEVAGDGKDNDCDGEVDEEEGSCYATRVVSFRQGPRADNKGVISPGISMPGRALGVPQEHKTHNFVSLGFGGELVLELGAALYDDGTTAADLMVVETTWGWAHRPCYSGKNAGVPETMMMHVSANGTDWVRVPGSFCRNVKVDLSPVVGGKGKLPYVRYVKITDTSNPADFNHSGNGYDVDGIITCRELFDGMNTNSRTKGGYDENFFNEALEDEEVTLEKLSFYPNPVKDQLTIQTGSFKEESLQVEIFTLAGVRVYQATHKADAAQLQLDLQNLKQGVYLLRLQDKEQQQSLKFMKE